MDYYARTGAYPWGRGYSQPGMSVRASIHAPFSGQDKVFGADLSESRVFMDHSCCSHMTGENYMTGNVGGTRDGRMAQETEGMGNGTMTEVDQMRERRNSAGNSQTAGSSAMDRTAQMLGNGPMGKGNQITGGGETGVIPGEMTMDSGMEMVPSQPSQNMDEENIDNFPLAMAYIPWQRWQQVYSVDQAMSRGTIFPDLDKPFSMGRC